MPADDFPERVLATRRGFDAAFKRMCAAASVQDAEDELHNVLSWFYRLTEVVKKRLTETVFFEKLNGSENLRTANALIWVRTFDGHDAEVVADLSDVLSDYFTEMVGVLVWKPLTDLPKQDDRHGRHEHYQNLAGRPVLDSIRSAFDDVAALV